MKIDHHEIYKTLVNNYPWLWHAPSHSVPDDDYKKAFKLNGADWFPYCAYYDLDVLNEIKDKLFSFGTILANGVGLVFRGLFQISEDVHCWALISKHPHDNNKVVVYFDLICRNNYDFLDFYKRVEPFEYKKEEAYGFAMGIPQSRPQTSLPFQTSNP